MFVRALLLAALLALALSGCVGSSEPRRPGEGREPAPRPESSDRTGGGRDPDRFSIEAHLPRSGDPARPNVQVQVEVVEVEQGQALSLSGGVRGSIVRGVLSLQASARARARSGRRRTSTTSFIVVQAGARGAIQLQQQAVHCLGGTYQSLMVEVREASPERVHLLLSPVTSVRGGREELALASEVTIVPGQAILLGGFSQSDAREGRGLGSYRERGYERELVALLTVRVLG